MKAALAEYVQLVDKRKIPVQEFEDSTATLLKARYDLKTYVNVTPSLRALMDGHSYADEYLFNIALNNGLPTLQ